MTQANELNIVNIIETHKMLSFTNSVGMILKGYAFENCYTPAINGQHCPRTVIDKHECVMKYNNIYL